jgi:cytochrome c oxidase accessory protein FixG
VSARGSIASDGRRLPIYPADVRGRWIRARRAVFAVLIVLWASLPFVQVQGHPAIFLDIGLRRFFLFGASFNAQDVWLLFFLATGAAFALVYATAVLGRAWCGWACPQTVFIEALFRPMERWIMGTREARLKRDKHGWNAPRVARTALLCAVYFVLALAVSHLVIAYFVSLRGLWRDIAEGPRRHPEAFGWMSALTALAFVNFGFFREQFCLVLCPYGRMQSVLLDEDSLVVGYDQKRGEPRGARNTPGAGDCVSCNRCVVVCPTRIDIREGLQVDCIACTQCIDACDEVMDQLDRPRGLIRYDSLNGLARKPRKLVRPRIIAYSIFGLVGVVALTVAIRGRKTFESTLLRSRGAPFTVNSGAIRNTFEIHLVNKSTLPQRLTVEAQATHGESVMLPIREIEMAPLSDRVVPMIVALNQDAFRADFDVRLTVVGANRETQLLKAKFLGTTK